MRRGEIWWALIDERAPVVLLSGDEALELRAMRIVAPATDDEKRGFLVLSEVDALTYAAESASLDYRAVGVEMAIGADEGLPYQGVVRLALPRDGQIFCTWQLALSPSYLIERVGALSPARLGQFEHALRLAGIE